MSNKYRFLLGASLIASLALAAPAFAQNNQDNKPGWGFGRMGGHMGLEMRRNGVFGTVASINGNTLTVTAKGWSKDKTSTTSTTYAVDATNATVNKNGATSTLASVVVGDNVVIQGAFSGTNVTASSIIDHAAPPANTSTNGTTKGHSGFFGGIGNFFKHLFGF